MESRLIWSGFIVSGKEQVMGTDTTPAGTSSRLRALFSFPNPVNEVSARLVAAGVVLMCLLTIAFDLRWATIVIAYGFVARVLTGPTLSPLGQLVIRVVTPRLGIAERPVAGPPKRFAQGMGVAFSLTALILRRLRLLDCRRGVPRPARRRRTARVGFGYLPRMQGVRAPHARRCRARRDLRTLQQHLERPGRSSVETPAGASRQSSVVSRRR
jgi:hypothetical protein